MSTASIRFLPAIAVALAIGGCASIRESIIDAKDGAVLEEYNALNDCGRVEMVRRYLERGQVHDSFLDAYLPSDGVMLAMVMDLGERTGVSRDVSISHWRLMFANQQQWSPGEPWWSQFIEPWSAVLGCQGRILERSAILRMCDPEIAAVVDTVYGLPIVSTLRRPQSRVHIEEFNTLAWAGLLNAVDSMLIASGLDRATGEWPVSMGDWRVTCDGVLPRDADPEVYVYFGRIARDRYLVKVMTRTSVDAGPDLRNGEFPLWSDDPQFTRSGVIVVYQIGPDGPRALFTGEHPAPR